MAHPKKSSEETLRQTFDRIKQEIHALRKTRIAMAVENQNDAVDTPFETAVFTAGKNGPIDTPIEVARLLKTNTDSIDKETAPLKKSDPKNTDESDIQTPRP